MAMRVNHDKRLTKRCRYYDIGTCPYIEQKDCDFAHVYDDQRPPGMHLGMQRQQIEYYLHRAPGVYKDGMWCPFNRDAQPRPLHRSNMGPPEEYQLGYVPLGYGPKPYESMFALSADPTNLVFRAQPAPLHNMLDSPIVYVQPPVLPPSRRNRIFRYKTKRCRFYKPGKVCLNGDACTFIHDQEHDLLGILEHPPPSAPVPTNPLPKHEETPSREYFPISWRVISGGVLCGESHAADQNETDLSCSNDGFEFRSDEVDADPSESIDVVGSYKTTPGSSLTLPPVTFPSNSSSVFEEINNDAGMQTPARTAARQRPSSIPAMSIDGHASICRLFHAESPAGL